MAIHPFQLLFDQQRTKPFPDSARARIALSTYTTQDERIIVSAGDCRTVGEVEAAVDRLKKDLDRVLAEARRKFPKKQGGVD